MKKYFTFFLGTTIYANCFLSIDSYYFRTKYWKTLAKIKVLDDYKIFLQRQRCLEKKFNEKVQKNPDFKQRYKCTNTKTSRNIKYK